MTKQLVLLDPKPNWKLDERTREIGLKGVAQAREVLRRAAVDRHKAA